MALLAVEVLRCCPSCKSMVSADVREFVGRPVSPDTPRALPKVLFGERIYPFRPNTTSASEAHDAGSSSVASQCRGPGDLCEAFEKLSGTLGSAEMRPDRSPKW